jgi:hypothetical protein
METASQGLIPTRYKVKIPQVLSYPIGSSAISKALSGIQQYGQMILRFYYWTDLHLRNGRYEFIRVEYTNHSEGREWTRLGLYQRTEQYRYEIVVQPVPKVFRNRVSGLIVAEALPLIRDWLAMGSELGRQGSYVLAFFYDEKVDAVSIERSDKLEPIRG